MGLCRMSMRQLPTSWWRGGDLDRGESLMEIYNRAKVIEAITNKSMRNVCPACARESTWIVPSKANEPETLEAMMMVSQNDVFTGFAFAPMICGHCGFTAFLHLETLLKEQR